MVVLTSVAPGAAERGLQQQQQQQQRRNLFAHRPGPTQHDQSELGISWATSSVVTSQANQVDPPGMEVVLADGASARYLPDLGSADGPGMKVDLADGAAARYLPDSGSADGPG